MNFRRRTRGHLGAASPDPVPAPFPDGVIPRWAHGLNDGSRLPRRSGYRWALIADEVLGYGTVGHETVLHARVFTASEPDSSAIRPRPDVPPVVILAEFGDHVGPSISNSIEAAAAAAQARFCPDGQLMRVVAMYPHTQHCLTAPIAPLLLREVTFADRYRRPGRARAPDRRRAAREQLRGLRSSAITEIGPHGATRHQLPPPEVDENVWVFRDTATGRDLALELPDAERDAIYGDPYSDLRWSRPAAVRVPALLGETELATWPRELYIPALVAGPEAATYAEHRRQASQQRLTAEMGFVEALTDPAPGSITHLDTGGLDLPPDHGPEIDEPNDPDDPPPRPMS